jgi:hypothetical protein
MMMRFILCIILIITSTLSAIPQNFRPPDLAPGGQLITTLMSQTENVVN